MAYKTASPRGEDVLILLAVDHAFEILNFQFPLAATPRDAFGTGVKGDLTGRNVAYESFKQVESQIIDHYELLSDPDDQEMFYDYLIANLKLYFDKFEEELDGSVDEPTNQAYKSAKQKMDEPTDPLAEGAHIDLEI